MLEPERVVRWVALACAIVTRITSEVERYDPCPVLRNGLVLIRVLIPGSVY